MTSRGIGLLLIAAGLSAAGGGFWLARKYAAAANDTGLVNPYPRHQGLLALVGQLLVVVGLVIVLIGGMVGFA